MPCSDRQTHTATMDHSQNVMTSQLQDSTSADLLYKKILAPRVEHINHASRIGVRLKSAALLERSPSATGSAGTGLPTRIKSSPQKYSGYQQPTQYIHDIVVPIQRSPSYDTDPRHLTSASSSQIYSHLPRMGGSARPRRGLTVSAAASSTGSPLVDAVLQKKEGRGPWKNNKQVMRFEMEQKDRARCRLFKKVSEVRPHRVDRMYYMSGAPVHLKNRFHVDEEELEQLKQLAKARCDAKQYGRGFSASRSQPFLTTGPDAVSDKEFPRQPPPSCSMSNAVTGGAASSAHPEGSVKQEEAQDEHPTAEEDNTKPQAADSARPHTARSIDSVDETSLMNHMNTAPTAQSGADHAADSMDQDQLQPVTDSCTEKPPTPDKEDTSHGDVSAVPNASTENPTLSPHQQETDKMDNPSQEPAADSNQETADETPSENADTYSSNKNTHEGQSQEPAADQSSHNEHKSNTDHSNLGLKAKEISDEANGIIEAQDAPVTTQHDTEDQADMATQATGNASCEGDGDRGDSEHTHRSAAKIPQQNDSAELLNLNSQQTETLQNTAEAPQGQGNEDSGNDTVEPAESKNNEDTYNETVVANEKEGNYNHNNNNHNTVHTDHWLHRNTSIESFKLTDPLVLDAAKEFVAFDQEKGKETSLKQLSSGDPKAGGNKWQRRVLAKHAWASLETDVAEAEEEEEGEDERMNEETTADAQVVSQGAVYVDDSVNDNGNSDVCAVDNPDEGSADKKCDGEISGGTPADSNASNVNASAKTTSATDERFAKDSTCADKTQKELVSSAADCTEETALATVVPVATDSSREDLLRESKTKKAPDRGPQLTLPRGRFVLDTAERKYWREDPLEASFGREEHHIKQRIERARKGVKKATVKAKKPVHIPEQPDTLTGSLNISGCMATARAFVAAKSKKGKKSHGEGQAQGQSQVHAEHEGHGEGHEEDKVESEPDLSNGMTLEEVLANEDIERTLLQEAAQLNPDIPDDIQITIKGPGNSSLMLDVYSFVQPTQREIFSKKFKELDYKGQGHVTLDDLHLQMFKDASPQDLQYFMRVFDLNRTGSVSEEEFITVAALNDKLTGKLTRSVESPLELNLAKLAYYVTVYKEMFDYADEQKKGRITVGELLLLLTTALGPETGLDIEMAACIHKVVDRNGNGSIEFLEYLSYIPFFLKVHSMMLSRPVMVEEIEVARKAVREALLRSQATHSKGPEFS